MFLGSTGLPAFRGERNFAIGSKEGTTPLIRAASLGGTHVVNLLLEEGADVEARNSRGMTALIAAVCALGNEITKPIPFDKKMRAHREGGSRLSRGREFLPDFIVV